MNNIYLQYGLPTNYSFVTQFIAICCDAKFSLLILIIILFFRSHINIELF